MLKIMYNANRYEGFEHTGVDGIVSAINIVEEVFGIRWQYKTFHVEEMFMVFFEIMKAFKSLIARYG